MSPFRVGTYVAGIHAAVVILLTLMFFSGGHGPAAGNIIHYVDFPLVWLANVVVPPPYGDLVQIGLFLAIVLAGSGIYGAIAGALVSILGRFRR